MKRFLSGLLTVIALSLLVACAQKPVSAPINAAVEGAQRLERRASAAYSKGDLLGAQKDYTTAAAVYASLALESPLALVQLNLARLKGESGRAVEGLQMVQSVLRTENLSESAKLLAHGRAAALLLAVQKNSEALAHLGAADVLCASSCDAASALAAIRAEILMQSGQLRPASLAGGVALQAAKTNADRANALRTLASIGLESLSVGGAGQTGPTGQSALASTVATKAIASAELALALDQTIGASGRVIADLWLLAQLHDKAGNANKAASYLEKHTAANAAREQLRLK